MRSVLQLLALLAIPVLCAASPADVKTVIYQGTLGDQPIVMKLPADPANAKYFESSYFFPRYAIDHFLDISAVRADQLRMVASAQEFPQWNLVRQTDGGWKGTWTDGNGRSMPVLLHHATLPPLPTDASDFLKHAREQQPYAYLRLRDMPLERGRRENFMGYTLQWWREPRSNIDLFTVADGYETAPRQRLNDALLSELWKQVDGYYRCVGASPTGGSLEFSATPTLLSSSIVSIKTVVEFYCGGAHGDTGYASINLDAHTGKKFALGDVIDLGDKRPLGEIFGPWLRTQLAALYPEHMQGKIDDCGYEQADNDTWTWPDWYMTPKGIFFIPYFPHVVAACTYMDDWSLLPWDRFTAQDVKLKRPLPGSMRASPHLAASASTPDDPAQRRNITLEQGKQQVFMGFTLQWWNEPVSGLKVFQIVSHGQIQQSFTRANNTLMQLLWQQIGHYYACQYSTRAKPTVSVRPTFLNGSLVSADFSTSNVDPFVNRIETAHGCDAGNDNRAPITIDIDSGRILSLSDFFNATTDAATPRVADRQTADWLITQFKTLYPKRMNGIEPTCNFANPDIWLAPKYYLTPNGIFFYPDFARASQSAHVCIASDDWSLLPWTTLDRNRVGVHVPDRMVGANPRTK
ncbi:MAG TPA: hypothetical protein VFN13_12790 [Rudaea sp.]|nr:hypothetical protein [Rudaea sp.]